MSRSYRHSPFLSWHRDVSEAPDKRRWHKRFRRRERIKLKVLLKDLDRWDGYNTTVVLDVSIRWTMRKESKLYWPDLACFTHYKRQKNELKLASAETYAYCRKWYFK